ncbi:hypothetical protein Agub_g165 [Astrephomene gubernaculifera]|uniref:Carbohydrate kinase PfkB domain-containing protein n=1 Tax=Astrephomene gubernaculifera TaxID=47775 RepID=A0AAD3DDE2_9CHLO|nr:hypothetical protein Agub_g165 [Astrephomene gubernaculifera]
MSSSPQQEGVRVAVLQVSAFVDHVSTVERSTLERLVGNEVAGSRRCTLKELQDILAAVGEFHSKAGGSPSNVGRALAMGFGTSVQVVGARGADEWGGLYVSSMRRAGVDTERMRVQQEGSTGRAAILTCEGERTMRTFMDPRVTTLPEDLSPDDFRGCRWVFLSAYSLYTEGLLGRAVGLAGEAGARVVLDLASYEVVEAYHRELKAVLESGGVHFCVCNEDEAQMLVRCLGDSSSSSSSSSAAPSSSSTTPTTPIDATDATAAAGYPPDSRLPSTALSLLLRYCEGAVVTRGVLGCVAACREGPACGCAAATGAAAGEEEVEKGVGKEKAVEEVGAVEVEVDACGGGGARVRGRVVAVAAVPGVAVVDTTGAGDHFTAGFMYGLMSGFPLERCCEVGCLAGAAAVRGVGAELGPQDWQWFHARLNGDLAGDVVQDSSAAEVAQELLGCYALIGRLGRGAVYFGSARLAQGSPFWGRAVRLAERVARLLGSPVWTGGGPGMMRAASEGGLRAGVPVGGIRISREAGTNVLTMEDYLPAGAAFTCKYLPARKVALTDAGARQVPDQRTAYLFLPGGLGTMDELFSVLTLLQLGKLGSRLPVPLLVLNWDGFYDGLMSLLRAFDQSGALRASEVREVMVATSNDEVLEYLAKFYDLPIPESEPDECIDLDAREPLAGGCCGAVLGGEEEEDGAGAENGGVCSAGKRAGSGSCSGEDAAAAAEAEAEEKEELQTRLRRLAAASDEEVEEAGAGASAVVSSASAPASAPASVPVSSPATACGTPHGAGAACSRRRAASHCGGGGGAGGHAGAGAGAQHAVSAEDVLLNGAPGTPRKV